MNDTTLCTIDYRDSDWGYRTIEIPLAISSIGKGFQYAKTEAALHINKQTKYGVQRIDKITIKSTHTPLL
jgi:hypothetical protein